MRGAVSLSLCVLAACGPKAAPPAPATPPTLTEHCATQVGEPRVLEVVSGVWVAIGYDLANIVLIETAAGHVIVDAGMSPARAAEAHQQRMPLILPDAAQHRGSTPPCGRKRLLSSRQFLARLDQPVGSASDRNARLEDIVVVDAHRVGG